NELGEKTHLPGIDEFLRVLGMGAGNSGQKKPGIENPQGGDAGNQEVSVGKGNLEQVLDGRQADAKSDEYEQGITQGQGKAGGQFLVEPPESIHGCAPPQGRSQGRA